MTDRYKELTVTLKEDLREDDAQHIIDAIQMIKGVQDVTPSVQTSEDHMNRERIRREFREKIHDLLRDFSEF